MSLSRDDTFDVPGPSDPGDDVFRPATEVFGDDLDFLAQRGRDDPRTTSIASNLARQSLYVKFDPLVAVTSEEIRAEAVNEQEQHGDLMAMTSPGAPNSKNVGEGRMESPESPEQRPDIDKSQDMFENDQSVATNKSSQSSDQLEDLADVIERKTQHIAELERILGANEERMQKWRGECQRRRGSEAQMTAMLNEYEATMNELIAEKEKKRLEDEEQRKKFTEEQEQTSEHLRNIEASFADVHRKYERNKKIIEGFKENEQAQKSALEEYERRVKQGERKFELLKQHAEETLEQANLEIEQLEQQGQGEVARLTALLKKIELKVAMLERSVEQKTRENDELSTICDDLIAKVGS